jgi:hypothetical protein
MIDQDITTEAHDAAQQRSAERRRFLKLAGGGAAATGGVMLLSSCFGGNNNNNSTSPTPTPSPTPTATSTATPELDVLNFALNIEYLMAQYFAFATTGSGLSADVLTGTGTAGTATGGGPVAFADPVLSAYAREMAADMRAHVVWLRSLTTSSTTSSTVAMPDIDVSASATGGFTTLARLGGVVGASSTFDPYASDTNFLLGAFVLADLTVTAYKGLSPVLVSNAAYLEGLAGALAAHAYHAGTIRSTLYTLGATTPLVRTQALQFSNARDSLDGTAASQKYDQGVTGLDSSGAILSTVANVTPADATGIAFSRSTGQVLNILYGTKASVMKGGFFPNGFNGNVKTSNAST